MNLVQSVGSYKFHISMQMNFVSRAFEIYCTIKNLKRPTGNNEKLRVEGMFPQFPCSKFNNQNNIS
jgi:hypothetical protein